jgi:hypothetical protein
MTPTSKLLCPPPAGQVRTVVNLFVLCFLVFQIVVPMTYYLGAPTLDERFSWRMFSSVILQICEISSFETRMRNGKRVVIRTSLSPEYHQGWIRLLRRYNPQLVRAALRRQCERPGAVSTHLMRQCQSPGGDTLPEDGVTRDCASGKTYLARD